MHIWGLRGIDGNFRADHCADCIPNHFFRMLHVPIASYCHWVPVSGCPVRHWVCVGRHLRVIFTPVWTSESPAWTPPGFQLRVFFFHKCTLVYSRTIVNCTCCFLVNPLYIHHPPSRSRCSRSWCPRSSRGKSLTAEAPTINRINSSQEHSSGRTHQFHYLSWTEAILALCHSEAKVLQAWSPPKPLCRDNMQQLSNALCQSLSAWNIHLAGKNLI